jgi:hypothetical protein
MRNLISLGLGLSTVMVASPVRAQLAAYYRGTVVNAQLRDRPATLEFSIFEQSDSQTAGWLRIGPPLGGTGVAYAVLKDLDSLYLVSVSKAGDTIVWVELSEVVTGFVAVHIPAKVGHGALNLIDDCPSLHLS